MESLIEKLDAVSSLYLEAQEEVRKLDDKDERVMLSRILEIHGLTIETTRKTVSLHLEHNWKTKHLARNIEEARELIVRILTLLRQ